MKEFAQHAFPADAASGNVSVFGPFQVRTSRLAGQTNKSRDPDRDEFHFICRPTRGYCGTEERS